MATTSLPAKQTFDAPSPYITAAGNSVDNVLPGYVKVPASGDLPAYAVFQDEIRTSPNDDRAYRLILLPNGIEALLISDPTTDKASAAIDVKAGHLNDPEDLPGLAHFCEHLMFMGTEKYPKEAEYSEYLTQNAGSSNAFTGLDQTCYYFDVHPSALSGALDRFAQFFIAPLFDPSCTEREANAVNSENSKNLQSDTWRMFQLDKSTSSPSHSFWRFGTGNKETLWDEPQKRGEDVRTRLIEWHDKHYSANLIKLVVLGKDSLDVLAKEVLEKFSVVQNRNLPPPLFPGNPLTERELQTTILLKSVKDQRILDLSFPFPDEGPTYATKPGSFLAHMLGHEGPGSILSLLKAKGWANGLSAGAGNGASGFEFFKLHVDLTQDGLVHYEEVVQVIFSYIDLLKATPPQQWAFEEVMSLSALAFRFKEKGPPTSTAMRLSLQMSKPYPRAKLLSAPYIADDWNPELIKSSIAALGPETARIMIASQEPVRGIALDQKEKWYGTEYTIIPTAESILKDHSASKFPELVLPTPNTFIPVDLEIKNKVEVTKPAERPLSILNTPTSRVWYKKDDRWWVPRAGAFFLLRSPLVDNTALNSVKSRFATELIRDSLQEYAYNAELAGLSYGFDSQADGIVLTIDGYNDKLAVLAKVVFEKIRTLQIDPQRFEIIKDQLRRAFVNNRLVEPYQHVAADVLLLTQETLWTNDQRLEEIDAITVENLQSYLTELLERLHIETLVHGNVLKDEALNLAKIAETTLTPKPLASEELRSHRALIVPEGKFLATRVVPNPAAENSSVEQFTYIGDITDDPLRIRLSVLGHLIQEPVFEDLRTKQQLGYIVGSGPRRSLGFMGLRVVVQSERSPAYVEGQIDLFWVEFKDTLEKMSEEEFEKHKEAVVNKLTEDHKNMWQESSFLWLCIHSGYYDFLQRERDAELAKSLTKADVVTFFRAYFFDSPEHRIRRLSSHLQSQRLQPDTLAPLLPSLTALGVEVDPAQFGALAQSKPPLEELKQFTVGFLKSKGIEDEVVATYVEGLDRLKDPEPVPEDVTRIEDWEQFRKDAKRASYAYPAKEYADLFPKL